MATFADDFQGEIYGLRREGIDPSLKDRGAGRTMREAVGIAGAVLPTERGGKRRTATAEARSTARGGPQETERALDK